MWPQRDPHQVCPPCLSIICHVSHVRHVPPHVNPPHRSGSESGQDKVSYQCLNSFLWTGRRWLHSSSFSKTNPTDRVSRPPRRARRTNPGRKRRCCRRVSSSCFSPRWRLCSSAVHLLRQHQISTMIHNRSHMSLVTTFSISPSSQAHSSLPHGLSQQPTAARSPLLS